MAAIEKRGQRGNYPVERFKFNRVWVLFTDIVQRLVFQDEEGNIVSETDSSLVGKLIEVRFNSLHQESQEDSLLMSQYGSVKEYS
jgi:hypothetical protein